LGSEQIVARYCRSQADPGAFSINDEYTQKENMMVANQLMQQNGKAPTMHL